MPIYAFAYCCCRIADGPLRVQLSTTLLPDTPGQPFGVAATVFSNSDDSQLGPQTVVTVRVLPDPSSSPSCGVGPSCTVPSGQPAAAAKCQLSLPCIGKFIIQVH
jgi:hypothetical protein